jgi:hypothetical protein
VAACGERRHCSDGEGRRVAARGDRRGGGWRRPWGPGSVMWGGARGSGDRGLVRRCSDGEGRRVATRGDRRGGGWRRKEIGGVKSCSTDMGTGWWSRSRRGTLRVSAEVADTLSAKSAHGD